MAGKIKGITIEIAGNTQPLNKALEDVNKKSKDIQSELRQVERLLKLDPKNTELLAQKQKLLADSVGEAKGKLDLLREAQRQVTEQFRRGEKVGEEQYRALQREIVQAEQNLKRLETQLRETGLTAEKVGTAMQNAGKKMSDTGKDLTLKVTTPILAAGAAAYKFGAELEDAVGAADQIFKAQSKEIQEWADSLESYYGIAEGEALEYANMMGSMLQNIGGLSEEQAAKQSATLIELAGDLTAMYGGTTADAVRALTGALKGNNTMLDNYGMAVNDAMVKTKAMEMGIYSGTGQMDLAAKQAATLALVMEQSGAAQGQAAREADGSSGAMRALATEVKNLAGDFGEILNPIITPFIAQLRDMIAGFREMSPATQRMIVVIAGIAAAIGPLLIILGTLSSSFGSIVALFGKEGALVKAAGIIAKLFGPGGTIAKAFAFLTGPIGLTIAAIAALIAAGVLLYQNWDKIKEYAAALRDGIVAFIDAIKGAFLNLVDSAMNIGRQVIDGFWEGIRGAGGWLSRKVSEFFGSNVTDTVNRQFETRSPSKVFEDIGENLGLGLLQGIEGQRSAIQSALSGIAGPDLSIATGGGSIQHAVGGHITVSISGPGAQYLNNSRIAAEVEDALARTIRDNDRRLTVRRPVLGINW